MPSASDPQSAMPPRPAAPVVLNPSDASRVTKNASDRDVATSLTGSRHVDTKKRRAESPTLGKAAAKKAKVVPVEVIDISSDEDEAVPVKEKEKEKEKKGVNDAAEKQRKELDEVLRFRLSDHTPRSMTAVMAAISYEGCYVPDTIDEMVDVVITELMLRVLDGINIEKEIAAINKIDQDYRNPKPNNAPKRIPQDVQQRLNKAEDMLDNLSKKELKNVARELGHCSNGGTNAMIAEGIVQALYHKAHRGGDLKQEYSIIKEYCYDECGERSEDGF